jgi:hypothetical protein
MKVFWVLVLFINLFIANPVFAGVMTKMVEVDSECSTELDVMRVELDEVKASNLSLNDRINRLLNDNILLTAENKSLKEKNAVLTMQISGLKQNNAEMTNKIQELKTQFEAQALAQSALAKQVSLNSNEDEESVEVPKNKNISNYLWPVVSAPLGAVTGTLRGAMNKSIEYADNASIEAPKNLPSSLVAKIGGLVVGNIAGAVTGLFRGFVDGIRYGFSDPFSAKSVSLDGDYASDWDPYQL